MLSEVMWYARDARIETKSAREKALRLVEEIEAGNVREARTDEQADFVALHTCAYQAARSGGDDRRSRVESERWARRWELLRAHIVERNLGLAYSMTWRFGSSRWDDDERISDALLGLTRAVDRFNPWRGYRFSTYACNVIARALKRQGRRERKYREVFPVQYAEPFAQTVPPPDTQMQLYLERLERALYRNAGGLTKLESRVLADRFPDDGKPRLTFQEIGRKVGLSKERVRQILNAALGKLRHAMELDPVLQPAPAARKRWGRRS